MPRSLQPLAEPRDRYSSTMTRYCPSNLPACGVARDYDNAIVLPALGRNICIERTVIQSMDDLLCSINAIAVPDFDWCSSNVARCNRGE